MRIAPALLSLAALGCSDKPATPTATAVPAEGSAIITGPAGSAAPNGFDKLRVLVDGQRVAMTRGFIKRVSPDQWRILVGDLEGSCDELLSGVTDRKPGGVSFVASIGRRIQPDGSDAVVVTDFWSSGHPTASVTSTAAVSGTADKGSQTFVTLAKITEIDDRGAPPVGSAAEWRRGSIDDRGAPPVGSAAEWRRGSIDDRGAPPVGSAAEWRRGSVDDRGAPPVGSAAEWRRGSVDTTRKLEVDGAFTATGCGDQATPAVGLPKASHPTTASIIIAGRRLPLRNAVRDGDVITLTTGPRDCSPPTVPAQAVLSRRAARWELTGTWFAEPSAATENGDLKLTPGEIGDSADGATVALELSGTGKLGDYTIELSGTIEALDCQLPIATPARRAHR